MKGVLISAVARVRPERPRRERTRAPLSAGLPSATPAPVRLARSPSGNAAYRPVRGPVPAS